VRTPPAVPPSGQLVLAERMGDDRRCSGAAHATDSIGPFLLSSPRGPLITPDHLQPRKSQTRRPAFHPGRGMELASLHGGMVLELRRSAADAARIGLHGGEPMSGAGWGITLGIIYFVLLVVFAVLSFRKGHWVLGLIGFIFPILWIIGAILPSRYARR
jgi:hypothetical protein